MRELLDETVYTPDGPVTTPRQKFTTGRVAAVCGVSRLTVRNWILTGIVTGRFTSKERRVHLRASRGPDGSWTVERADLEAFLAETGREFATTPGEA